MQDNTILVCSVPRQNTTLYYISKICGFCIRADYCGEGLYLTGVHSLFFVGKVSNLRIERSSLKRLILTLSDYDKNICYQLVDSGLEINV